MRLRWAAQRKLDCVLATAAPEVRDRLEQLRDQSAAAGRSRESAPDLVAMLLDPPQPADAPRPPALFQLERQVARLRIGYQECRFEETVHRLPGLMRLLGGARRDMPRERVSKLTAEAYQVTTGVLLRKGDLPMAMLAARRCAEQAEASGQPEAIAAGARATARVLVCCGHAAGAAALTDSAAHRLHAVTGLDGPRPLSAYGALLLRSSIAHARMGDGPQAMAALDEAGQAAQQLGQDGNFGWTAFGPTNVTLHRLNALLALGDPEAALAAARHLDPEAIRLTERRAAYYMDTSEALRQLGRGRDARAALTKAARIAPELIPRSPA